MPPRWPARRRPHSGSPSSRTDPGWCHPHRMARAAAKEPRRPDQAAPAPTGHDSQLAACHTPHQHGVMRVLAEHRQVTVRLMQAGDRRFTHPDPSAGRSDSDAHDVIAVAVHGGQHGRRRQQETPCSPLVPPKITATRVRGAEVPTTGRSSLMASSRRRYRSDTLPAAAPKRGRRARPTHEQDPRRMTFDRDPGRHVWPTGAPGRCSLQPTGCIRLDLRRITPS